MKRRFLILEHIMLLSISLFTSLAANAVEAIKKEELEQCEKNQENPVLSSDFCPLTKSPKSEQEDQETVPALFFSFDFQNPHARGTSNYQDLGKEEDYLNNLSQDLLQAFNFSNSSFIEKTSNVAMKSSEVLSNIFFPKYFVISLEQFLGFLGGKYSENIPKAGTYKAFSKTLKRSLNTVILAIQNQEENIKGQKNIPDKIELITQLLDKIAGKIGAEVIGNSLYYGLIPAFFKRAENSNNAFFDKSNFAQLLLTPTSIGLILYIDSISYDMLSKEERDKTLNTQIKRVFEKNIVFPLLIDAGIHSVFFQRLLEKLPTPSGLRNLIPHITEDKDKLKLVAYFSKRWSKVLTPVLLDVFDHYVMGKNQEDFTEKIAETLLISFAMDAGNNLFLLFAPAFAKKSLTLVSPFLNGAITMLVVWHFIDYIYRYLSDEEFFTGESNSVVLSYAAYAFTKLFELWLAGTMLE